MLIDAGWAKPSPEARTDYSDLADITQFHPDVDMPELLRYAKEKNVKIWVWSHWTSVDKYMDQAFPLFEKWGIAGVKIDFMDRDDQWMVDWYRRVAQNAADHHLHARLSRCIQARRVAPHLSQPAYARGRHGQGIFQVERARYSGPQHHAAIHAHARRPARLHSRRLQQFKPRKFYRAQ